VGLRLGLPARHWLGAHCPILPSRRLAATRANGRQLERTMLVRSGEVAWTDIWNTVGLRGTATTVRPH